MEEESMEEEGGGGCEAMMDDQNHNNWGAGGYGRHLLGPATAAPLGDRLLRGPAGPPAGPLLPMEPEANGVLRGCDAAGAAGKGGPGAIAAAAININLKVTKCNFPLFLAVMNVITIEDYKSTYWPKLDSAIDQLLTQSPGDYIPISYEQIYSCVYKCVCQQHSEQMYSDLIKKITNHLERVSKELQVRTLLLEAQSTPFQITPSTMANIVKGLYTLRPGKKRSAQVSHYCCSDIFHRIYVGGNYVMCIYHAHVCCVLPVIMLSCTATCTRRYSKHVGTKVVLFFGFFVVFLTQITQQQTLL
uniref:CDK2 associated cullin domain 1 n=1 Tax=Pavo cristatus TaxID=9049 RepID=A0A8C9L454_PAVCR